MAKTEFTKQRLLALMEILQQETDENHRLGAEALEAKLKQRGIETERKSIYRDIAALQNAGWDILSGRSGYCLASRDFELAELKLLADAVQCSRCITEKKSLELISKLEKLTSRYNAGKLHRQLQLVGRSKAENEQIYYNVDALYEAIAQNREITFRYLEYKSDGSRVYRPKVYVASPYGLCWDSENYYLVAHTVERGRTHYRVDRMAKIELTEEPRKCPELYRDLNMAQYAKQVFGMFGGEPVGVRLQFPESLADSAVDKFGKDVMMIPQENGTFTLTATVAISPVFFSWVFSFGGRVKILGPESVVEQYKEMCQKALEP
jgi:predicted DNA-binding transcriptional regulator YafY